MAVVVNDLCLAPGPGTTLWICSLKKGHVGSHAAYIDHNLDGHLLDTWPVHKHPDVTQGEKQEKPCKLGAIDPLALEQLGLVAGFGQEKYARWNYAKGYDWSLSIDALLRHVLDFLNRAKVDAESGLHPLAHAAWQCLALLTFDERGLGNDDRFPK